MAEVVVGTDVVAVGPVAAAWVDDVGGDVGAGMATDVDDLAAAELAAVMLTVVAGGTDVILLVDRVVEASALTSAGATDVMSVLVKVAVTSLLASGVVDAFLLVVVRAGVDVEDTPDVV